MLRNPDVVAELGGFLIRRLWDRAVARALLAGPRHDTLLAG
ncbi:hypothetical protein [Streptosporangium sp. CA-115845]